MKKSAALLMLALCISMPAMAQTVPPTAPLKPTTPQAEKMKSCAAEYQQKNIAKNEYRKFMSFCLKKDYVTGSYMPGVTGATNGVVTQNPALATKKDAMAPITPDQEAPPMLKPMTPQERMKECNNNATTMNMQGADRNKFMSECLKVKATGQ